MGSGWVPISPLPVPYPHFEIGENPNPYPNPIKPGKTCQIGDGLGGYPRARVLLPGLGTTRVGNRSGRPTGVCGLACYGMTFLFSREA